MLRPSKHSKMSWNSSLSCFACFFGCVTSSMCDNSRKKCEKATYMIFRIFSHFFANYHTLKKLHIRKNMRNRINLNFMTFYCVLTVVALFLKCTLAIWWISHFFVNLGLFLISSHFFTSKILTPFSKIKTTPRDKFSENFNKNS